MIIFFTSVFQNAQNGLNNSFSISGFVYDKTNGEALIGANVYIKELGVGASSNISGYFVIPDLHTGVYNLECSYIGYSSKSKQINVNELEEVHLEIWLEPNSIETQEVVVSETKERTIEKLFEKPVSKIELSPSQINNIPKVIEADLLRALQTLPGITSLSDFSSALYIRGGTPDQNLFLVDGTDVYNPEHAFGIFSTFNTNAIKKVEISKGGFGAEYGGRLSSVLDITNVDGNRNNFEGIVNVSLLSASTTLQAPIGSIGSLSGSFRRTYIDQTYAKWIDEVPAYYFYDSNLKAYFDFDRRNKVSVSFFNSKDDLDFKLDKDAKESFSFLYNWGNTTGSINWKHIFNTKIFSSFWFTASRFKSNFGFDAVQLSEENLISDYTAKASLEYYYSKELNLKFGAEQKVLHEMYDQDFVSERIYVDNRRQLTSAFAGAAYKPIERLNIEAGLRAYYFNSDTTFYNLEPRFSAKYRLTDNSNLKFAAGIYHQYINRIPRLFFTSIWTTANKYNSESESKHLVLGYQREIATLWEFEVETYYKQYTNMLQFNNHVGTVIVPTYHDEKGRPVYTSTENVFNSGDGESFGVEFLLRKDVGDLNGWVSYAWSQTNYKFASINQGNYFMPRHNRSSVINAVINADIGKMIFGLSSNSTSSWNMGVNFVYASGQPITVPGSAYYVSSMPDWNNTDNQNAGNSSYKLYPSDINSFNLPPYIRMDLSITYEKNYGSWSLSPYLQIINIGNRQNVWFVQYNEENTNDKIIQETETVTMLPLLPSIGVNIKF
jgi:hypothetical protein